MKKVYLILFFSIAIGIKTFSQASLVFDATNYAEAISTTAEIINLGQTMKKVQEIQENIEKLRKSVTWLKSAESVIQIIKLIEETACIIQQLDMNFNIALNLGITQSCIFNFQYKVSFSKLLTAIDQINSVLSEGTNMDQAQRWQIISIVLDNFTQSQMNFAALNYHIKRQIREKKQETKIVKERESYIRAFAENQ